MTSELSTVVQAIITDENEKYFFRSKEWRNIPSKKRRNVSPLFERKSTFHFHP